ncbi:tetratricopeptide repeat protein [Sulfurimonas sp.]|nr:tetratricopeptide repeat protein [Sulfurimonas sp.]
MRSSLLVLISSILLPYHTLSAEPSAFGAGDLNNPTPYGLTASEETLLKNKKQIKQVIVNSNNQADAVDSLRERVDGLQSVIESMSSNSRKNKLNIKELTQKNLDDMKALDEFDKRLMDSSQLNNELIQVNTTDIQKINLIIKEMTRLVDTINSSYVSKDEFNVLVSDVNNFKDLVSKELKNSPKENKMSNGEIESEAKKQYQKKLYGKSLKNYNYLINKNYKPARSHYMVGEIYYHRKNYAEAIAYFKKSAKLYSKASYMHVLMLHTAISMDKTGDKDNASNFYNALISKFPNSSSAKIAVEKLSLIN